MSAASIYELIGFIASLLIVVSITQKSILRLRIIGLIVDMGNEQGMLLQRPNCRWQLDAVFVSINGNAMHGGTNDRALKTQYGRQPK